ncbi:MAG: hypothetical protein MJZ49_05190 [Bacteroidales bacterium]|nr:hypothetical protein [Bacteroidales bacterium]
MKRLFTIFFALLLGITAAFAQTQPTLPYQAVVRDNQNHLLKDADVSIDVQIYEGATLRYSETQTPHSNANGLISFNIGAGSGATGTMADVADWRVAKFKFTYHLTDGDVVVTDSVHAVPYALQTAFATGGNFLTSDSAVITTMQGNITTNTTNIATNTDNIAALANRVNTFNTNVCDSVKDCDFSGNASIQNMLQELSDLISAQNHKIDSLGHIVDSLSNLPHGNTPAATFTCGTDSIKDFDNNWYHTVKIGEQCWMKENLRTTSYANGTGIELSSNTSRETAYCYYPNGQESYVSTYGYLYNWKAVMDTSSSSDANPSGVQGICPDGWHVPSDAEWTALTNYVKSQDEYKCGEDTNNIANALSSPTGWDNSNDTGCNAGNDNEKRNLTGFSAVPAGCLNDLGFGYFGDRAYFWSATLNDANNAKFRFLASNYSVVISSPGTKAYGISVRCLRDAEAGGGTTPSAPGGDNACCSELGARLDSLEHVISSQDSTINALNEQVNPFTCGTSKVKDADLNEYNTVKIGNQCWMKENLRTNVGGGAYPKNNHQTVTGDDTVTYGRLYTWDAMMKEAPSTNYPGETTDADTIVHGICPEGWHVPSDAEFDTLTYYVFNSTSPDYKCGDDCGEWQQRDVSCIANALSQPTGWSNTDTGCNAGNTGDKANATGFSAVPAGYCSSGQFRDFGYAAYFWSATQCTSTNAWYRYLNGYYVGKDNYYKNRGCSVRCLRDAGIGGTPGENEIAGTTPSAPATMSCEQVMECMGDTLGKLNEKIEAQGQTITTQGQTIDSLAHIVDSLSNLTPGGDTPTTTFTCGTDKVTDDDGNKYNTVKIGNQCWMAQNLRTNVDGSVYPKKNNGNDDLTTDEQIIYGRLYTWSAATGGSSTTYPAAGQVKVQGICPEGWHVPSDAEWDTLTYYVFNSTSPDYKCGSSCDTWQAQSDVSCIAKALASKTGWIEGVNACNVGKAQENNNATGFSAVPAGTSLYSSFSVFGSRAYFWSATQSGGNGAWSRNLSSLDSDVFRGNDFKDLGFSVRCLRD